MIWDWSWRIVNEEMIGLKRETKDKTREGGLNVGFRNADFDFFLLLIYFHIILNKVHSPIHKSQITAIFDNEMLKCHPVNLSRTIQLSVLGAIFSQQALVHWSRGTYPPVAWDCHLIS